MSEQNYVELNKSQIWSKPNLSNKKGISNIIIAVILIIVIISAVSILWVFIRGIILKSSLDTNCLEFIGFSAEKSCYLNEDEIRVMLKRGSDNLHIDKIRFGFLPSDSLWEISGSKCLDVRLEGKKYGNYCDILKTGEAFFYVFNASDLEKQEKVLVSVKSNELLCEVGEIKIMEAC